MPRKKAPATPAVTPKVFARCGTCGGEKEAMPRKDGAARLPPEWKEHRGAIWCKRCWKENFVLRAVQVPIARVLSGPGGWDEFLSAAQAAFAQGRSWANWAVAELAKADVVRTVDMQKLGPMQALSLGALYRAAHGGAVGRSQATVFRYVEAKYRAQRYDRIWLGRASLVSFRNPLPYPVRGTDWTAVDHRARAESSPRPAVDLPLLGQHWTVLLRGGPGFRRQFAQVRQIMSGEAKQGELALLEKKAGELWIKMVGYFPRRPPGALEGTMILSTDANAFWVAVLHDGKSRRGSEERPWVLNADHVRRWIAEHRNRLQRFREDLKPEKRWPGWQRKQMNEALGRRCDKQERRLKTWCQQAAACLAGYAARQRVAAVVYDDTCKSYLPLFPWHQQTVCLRHALDGCGIALHCKDDHEEGE